MAVVSTKLLSIKMHKKYKLGEYLLDASAQLLTKDEDRVHLNGLPLQVLVYLIENRDRLVSRAELLDHFWESRDVYDDSMRKAIGAIRKALADNSAQPRFIETKRAGGYRYIGPFEDLAETHNPVWQSALCATAEMEKLSGVRIVIEEETFESETNDDDLSRVKSSRPLTALLPGFKTHKTTLVSIFGLSVMTILVLVFYTRDNGNNENFSPPIRSIAVLPLKNLSGDASQDYFSDGLTEHLINTLAKIEGLKVISRGTAFTYKGHAVDPREAGNRLGVAAILTGSVLKLGERVRIEVRLVNTEDGHVLWASDSAEDKLGDIFAVQDEIARHVVAGLKIELSAEGQQRLTKRYTKNIEAYQASLKGDYFRNQRTPDGIQKAIESYQQAIALDPRYLSAYLGLSNSYYMGIWYIPLEPQEATARIKAAQTKALEIDDSSSDAHVALAGMLWLEWDWAGCLREVERAIELGLAASDYGYAYQLLLVAGQPDEAVRWIKRSAELDPLSPLVSANVGEILYYARRYDEAIAQCQKTLRLDPNYAMAHTHLGLAYVQKGRHNEAIAEFEKAIALSERTPDLLGHLGHAYAAAGRRGEAQRVLVELTEVSKQHHVPPYRLAEIYAALGDKDDAFAQLEQAYQAHAMHLCNLKVEPTLAPLRADPRFADLLRRVGLP